MIMENADKEDQKKEAWKTINLVFKTISANKQKNIEEIKNAVYPILKDLKKKILELKDDSDNTLAHLSIMDDKYESLVVITEIYIKCIGNNNEFFDWFLCKNNENLDVFDLSAQKGNKNIIKFLYEIISKTNETKLELTAPRNNVFHNAALQNQCYPIIFFFEHLQHFFKQNLIIDMPNANGITPLHYACISGSKDVMDLLLDMGCNINARDKEGNTCLHFGVSSGNERVVKKLLVRGADKTIKNNLNQSPYDLAVNTKKNEIAHILRQRTLLQKCFSQDIEITAIKGNRNNILLLLFVILLILGKVIFISRISFVLNPETNAYINSLMPFLPDIVDENNKYLPKEEKPLDTSFYLTHTGSLDDTFGCVISKCYIEITIIIISLIEDIGTLILIVFFLCYAKKVLLKKRSRKEVPSLSKLYEEEKLVCVKCRITVDSSTIHCLVCNSCIRNWDHHCFWLNTCINKSNKKSFSYFFWFMLFFFVMNSLFFLFLFISCVKQSKLFLFVVLGLSKYKYTVLKEKVEPPNEVIQTLAHVTWLVSVFLLFCSFMYWFLFGICPLVRDNIRKSNQSEVFSEYENKLLPSLEEPHQFNNKTDNQNELSNLDDSDNSYSF